MPTRDKQNSPSAAGLAAALRAPEAYTGERLAAEDERFAPDMARHLAAYHLVEPLVAGKTILEAGCGEGYGAHLLARSARRVLAIDYDEPALELARRRHRAPNLEYRAVNLLELARHSPGEFDAVTNFQVLEHLADPAPFLRAAAACLRPGGVLILTTPNRLASVSENPYHVHEYEAAELAGVLARFFGRVEVRGIVGSERVYAFERARGAQAQRILRLDPLGLRHLLPERLVRFAFARLALLVRSRLRARDASLVDLTTADFSLAQGEPPQWIDLLAVAERAEGGTPS
ncbi:MAG TPA: methyltransferase domain-containing protein [Candidatus Bathyarchaeia archaeon]|nr:methyltransferase domain-containing protein [Candidatus Bathyarchaeia archaeon]